MQFRERRRVIQVIRTTYDPEVKRGRSEVVGKLDKADPVVTDKLRKNCTDEELAEIETYLDHRAQNLHDDAVRAGAETLPAQMRAAAEYFRNHGDAQAAVFAGEIKEAWNELKAALRKADLRDGAGRRRAKPAEVAGETASEEADADEDE